MRIIALSLICSCAALNTAGMSEPCKVSYNACLNGCPDAPREGSPTPPPTARTNQVNPGIADCTARCNKQADSCK